MMETRQNIKSRHFDHIDLRVKDVERPRKFYVPVLKALGFTLDPNHTPTRIASS